jgi:hypothetical protein
MDNGIRRGKNGPVLLGTFPVRCKGNGGGSQDCATREISGFDGDRIHPKLGQLPAWKISSFPEENG